MFNCLNSASQIVCLQQKMLVASHLTLMVPDNVSQVSHALSEIFTVLLSVQSNTRLSGHTSDPELELLTDLHLAQQRLDMYKEDLQLFYNFMFCDRFHQCFAH